MSEWAGEHRCYFADPSGGFGWPSCVICGAPVSVQAEARLRRCCRTAEGGKHDPGCRSMDALRRFAEDYGSPSGRMA